MHLSVKNCQSLAEQIVKLFPSENQKTYFVRGKGKIPPKGKLWDRYQGRKRSIKKLTCYESRPRKLMKCSEEEDEAENNEEMITIFEELKHVRNWEEVLKKWKKTIQYRRKRLNNDDQNLENIFKDWPLFKYSKAPELIEMDFNACMPAKSFNFAKWQKKY